MGKADFSFHHFYLFDDLLFSFDKIFIPIVVRRFFFLGRILHFNNTFTVNEEIKLAIFTTFGAILGGATLGITSLHKYAAVNKKLDIDHLWGYLMAPILSVIIGILIFCLLYSGLIILTGGSNPDTEKNSVKIGYLCMGAICSYNWDVFIKSSNSYLNMYLKDNARLKE